MALWTSECISFGVNGLPGVNMGDALQKRFMGLDGLDNLELQDAKNLSIAVVALYITAG